MRLDRAPDQPVGIQVWRVAKKHTHRQLSIGTGDVLFDVGFLARGHVKVRYFGMVKNTAQLHTLLALSNGWMGLHRLLQKAQG